MSEEIVIEDVEVQTENAGIDWTALFSNETEQRTTVWLVSYSFPLNFDSDGNKLETPDIAGETFAARSKANALDRIVRILLDENVIARGGFDPKNYEQSTEGTIQLFKDVFSQNDSILNMQLVELV